MIELNIIESNLDNHRQLLTITLHNMIIDHYYAVLFYIYPLCPPIVNRVFSCLLWLFGYALFDTLHSYIDQIIEKIMIK